MWVRDSGHRQDAEVSISEHTRKSSGTRHSVQADRHQPGLTGRDKYTASFDTTLHTSAEFLTTKCRRSGRC